MIVKCEQCGTESQLDSIFCKSCGHKLNFENLNPQDIKKVQQHQSLHIFFAIKKIISIVLFLGVIYCLFSILYPSFTSYKTPSVNANILNDAYSNLRSIQLKKSGSYFFTNDELTILYNKNYLPNTLQTYPLIISTYKNKSIIFTRRISIHKSIPYMLSISVIGGPEFEVKNGNYYISKFQLERFKLGNLIIPSYFGKYLLPFFEPYANRSAMAIANKISNIKITQTGIEVSVD